MAELADAPRSGRGESNLLRVQIPPSAQKEVEIPLKGGFLIPTFRRVAVLVLTEIREKLAKCKSGQWYNKGESVRPFIS